MDYGLYHDGNGWNFLCLHFALPSFRDGNGFPDNNSCRKAPRETDGMMELPGGEVLRGHFRAFLSQFWSVSMADSASSAR